MQNKRSKCEIIAVTYLDQNCCIEYNLHITNTEKKLNVSKPKHMYKSISTESKFTGCSKMVWIK